MAASVPRSRGYLEAAHARLSDDFGVRSVETAALASEK